MYIRVPTFRSLGGPGSHVFTWIVLAVEGVVRHGFLFHLTTTITLKGQCHEIFSLRDFLQTMYTLLFIQFEVAKTDFKLFKFEIELIKKNKLRKKKTVQSLVI